MKQAEQYKDCDKTVLFYWVDVTVWIQLSSDYQENYNHYSTGGLKMERLAEMLNNHEDDHHHTLMIYLQTSHLQNMENWINVDTVTNLLQTTQGAVRHHCHRLMTRDFLLRSSPFLVVNSDFSILENINI